MNDDILNKTNHKQSRIKQIIFEFFYELIKLEGYDIYTYLIFTIIQTLQCFFWFFNGDLKDLWKNDQIATAIQDFCGYFMITPYFKTGSSFNQLLVVMYTSFGFLVAVMFLIIYLGIKVQQSQKNKQEGLFKIVKFCVEIMNPILFQPLFDVFFQPFRCVKKTDGNYYHLTFESQECYVGNYFLHLILGFLAAMLLLCMNYIIIVVYFESRYDPKQVFLKYTGRNEIKLVIFKMLIVLTNCFFNFDLIVLTLILMFLVQLSVFSDVNKSAIYLNKVFSKIMNLQAAILFWSTLMIIFALIVKNTVFRGIIYIWLVALPFIFLIVIIRKELRYDSLMVNSNNFESINQGVFQLTYFMQLLNYFYDDKHVAAILEALIYYHRTFCKQSGCPSNPKNMNQKKIKKFFKNAKIEDISKVNQNYVVLVFLIDRLYVMTLTKYPNCITLRINHALFLLDIMKSSQQTLQELHLAEQLDPQFDEQFQIYRYKKIIEEDIFSKKNGQINDQEISNEITIESHIKEIQYNIELSTNHHIEFWSQMAEDIPDLIKLYELGIKANQSSNLLEENWKKTEKLGLDLQAPNIMRIYIKYLLDVQHDKQSASDVISRLQLVYSTQNERAKKLTSMNDFQNESYSMVAVSGEDGSIGKVTALNIACSSEFGYTKSELLNRKVNTIMPQPFALCHDKIIEDYLNSLQPKYLNKERKLFGQTKLGYLKPILIYVRYVPSFIHGTQFFGSLKMEKYFKIVVYLLVDTKSLRVTNCTSNAIQVFGLTHNILLKKQIKIQEILPDYLINLTEYLTKQGQTQDLNYHIKKEKAKHQQFKINVLPQYMATKSIKQYVIKLEQIQNKVNIYQSSYENNGSYESVQNVIQYDRFNRKISFNYPVFQFKFDHFDNIYHGNLYIQLEKNTDFGQLNQLKQEEKNSKEAVIRQNIQQQFILPQNTREYVANLKYNKFRYQGQDIAEQNGTDGNMNTNTSIQNLNQKEEQEGSQKAQTFKPDSQEYEQTQLKENNGESQELKNSQIQNKNYGNGIRIYRLVGKQMIDIDDINQVIMTEDEEYEKDAVQKINNLSLDGKNNAGIDNEINERSNILKSRKALKKFLSQNNSVYQKSLTLLNIAGVILLLALIILALSSYLLMQNNFNQIQNNYELTYNATQRAQYVQRIHFKLQNYRFSNLGIYQTPDNTELDFQEIKENISQLEQIYNKIQQSSDESIFNQQQQKLFNEDVIQIQNMRSDSSIQTYKVDLNQATTSYVEKAYALTSDDTSDFTDDNENLYFITYQALNEYYFDGILQSNELFFDNLVNYNNAILTTIMIISFSISICSIFCIYPIFSYIGQNKNEVLKLFLEIPILNVKEIFRRIEIFSNSLQVGNEEDDQEDLENYIEIDDEQDFGVGRRRKTRKFKLESVSQKIFIIEFIFFILIAQVYFVISYIFGQSDANSLKQLKTEFNVTSQANPLYTESLNIIRLHFIDQNFAVKMTDGTDVIEEMIQNLYDYTSQISIEHTKNNDINSDSYNKYFDQIMEINACDALVEEGFSTKSECQSVLDGILQEGLASGLTRFFEELKYIITLYQNIKVDATYPFPEVENYVEVFSGNEQASKIASLINLDTTMAISEVLDTYFRNIFQLLTNNLLISIQDNIDSNNTMRIFLFISFVAILFLVYFFYWFPLVSKLSTQIKRTNLMLAIIPIEITEQTKLIKEYINKQIQVD